AMQTRTLGRVTALFLFILVSGVAVAAEPPRSGNPVFDRAVKLVVDRFYDAKALDRFGEAVQREIDDSKAPLTGAGPPARVDEAIANILASLQASHTGHFLQDSIAYYELADIFRYAIRDDLRRLFPPEGDVTYPGIGLIAREENGRLFAADVYDGSSANR